MRHGVLYVVDFINGEGLLQELVSSVNNWDFLELPGVVADKISRLIIINM